jgi:hypothetical protein
MVLSVVLEVDQPINGNVAKPQRQSITHSHAAPGIDTQMTAGRETRANACVAATSRLTCSNGKRVQRRT